MFRQKPEDMSKTIYLALQNRKQNEKFNLELCGSHFNWNALFTQ